MPVRETTMEWEQGYSIVRITETDSHNNTLMETYALQHEGGTLIDEFAEMTDAVLALNHMLEPLPGIPLTRFKSAC
ncbi:MAG: hypothetical protein R3296_02300 [Oleiphilaceae bacterium]|nr:hypothetical protein [Oleiphilaceae bacterium]